MNRSRRPPRAGPARAWMFLLLGTWPLLVAPKCITFESFMVGDAGAGPTEAAAPDGAGEDAPSPVDAAGPPPVRPAIPCPTPGQAYMEVTNFAYTILCGCEEREGRTCTVSAGTEVVWTFADAVEHNVTSLEDAFGRSADRLGGRFTATFDTPGEYGYGCTLHPRSMSGYAIVAR